MLCWRQVLRVSMASASVAAIAVSASPSGRSAPPEGQGCAAWDVTYAVSGKLEISDTPNGAGDGIYAIGPGKVVLNDARSGRVTMVSLDLPERFGVTAKIAFWTTYVDTNANARATPAAGAGECGHVAEGAMQGATVAWTTKVRGLRTDGTIECKGSLCGRFGAPPKGVSPLHVGPNNVQFQPFEFGPDGKTFTMSSAFLSTTDQPKQTAHLALSGREVSRTCAAACR
jgi:hypothetical protein